MAKALADLDAAKASMKEVADAMQAVTEAQAALTEAKKAQAEAGTKLAQAKNALTEAENTLTVKTAAKTTAEEEAKAAQEKADAADRVYQAAAQVLKDAKKETARIHSVYQRVKDAAASLAEAKDAKVKADQAVEEAKQKSLAASEALTAAKAKDALARTITLEDVLSARVTADGFTYLNQYGIAYQEAAEKAKNAENAYETAKTAHIAAKQKADELNRQVQIRKAAEEAVRKAEEAKKAEEARKAAEARRIAAEKAAKINAVKMPHVEAEEATTAHPNAIAATVTQTAAQPSVSGTVRTEPVKTADNAPVIPYAGSAAVASLLAMGLFLVRTRKDPDVM